MTLVLTEITETGIAMAADSLWTRQSGRSYPDPKLFPIPYLSCAVSTWGGTPNSHPPQYEWLPDLIADAEGESNTITDFAEILEDRAIREFGMMDRGSGALSGNQRASLGFHVAGYQDDKYKFFNINNNPSQGEPELQRGNRACVKLEDHRNRAIEDPKPWLVHNGDWEGFRLFIEMFRAYRDKLSSSAGEIAIPDSKQIQEHGKFLGLLILFIGGVWQLSNLTNVDPSHIGGEIHVVTMTPNDPVGPNRNSLKMTGEGLVLR